jgi:hypothetical protein
LWGGGGERQFNTLANQTKYATQIPKPMIQPRTHTPRKNGRERERENTHHTQLPVLKDLVRVLAHLPGEDHPQEAAHGGHVLAAGGLGAVWCMCVWVVWMRGGKEGGRGREGKGRGMYTNGGGRRAAAGAASAAMAYTHL